MHYILLFMTVEQFYLTESLTQKLNTLPLDTDLILHFQGINACSVYNVPHLLRQSNFLKKNILKKCEKVSVVILFIFNTTSKLIFYYSVQRR